MEQDSNPVKNLLIGVVLGITSMLPGISGATMAVVFGIYERLIRDVAKLRTYLIKDFGFLSVVIIGALIGTVVCAKVLNHALEQYPAEALMFFTGLILGQLPLLYRKIEGEERKNGNPLLAFMIGIVIMLGMILLDALGQVGEVDVGHDLGGVALMFLIGIVVAVSALLPGLSHSTILLAAGLMGAFTSTVSNMDLLLAPLALGIIAGAVIFSKIIEKALSDHHLVTMMFIIGLTAGSVLVIMWTAVKNIDGVLDIIAGMVCLIAGLALSIMSMKFEDS